MAKTQAAQTRSPNAVVPAAVERFLHGIQTGDWKGYEQALDPDAFYDGTMPGWRMQFLGRAQVAKETARDWTGRNTWRIVDQNVSQAGETVLVDFEIKGVRQDPDHGHAHELTCRIANIFLLRQGKIAEHRYFCAGEWPESVVRQVEREAPKARRPAH